MIYQKSPGFVIHQSEIYGDECIVPQRALCVDGSGYAAFSGSFFTSNHKGEICLNHLLDICLEVPWLPGDIVKAVVERIFYISTILVLDPVFADSQGNRTGGNEENRVLSAVKGKGKPFDGVQNPFNIFEALLRLSAGYGFFFQCLDYGVITSCGECRKEKFSCVVENNGFLFAILDDIAEKPVFFPENGMAAAEFDCLIKGVCNAF